MIGFPKSFVRWRASGDDRAAIALFDRIAAEVGISPRDGDHLDDLVEDIPDPPVRVLYRDAVDAARRGDEEACRAALVLVTGHRFEDVAAAVDLDMPAEGLDLGALVKRRIRVEAR